MRELGKPRHLRPPGFDSILVTDSGPIMHRLVCSSSSSTVVPSDPKRLALAKTKPSAP